jgi:hypothetical protein
MREHSYAWTLVVNMSTPKRKQAGLIVRFYSETEIQFDFEVAS